MIQWCVQYKPVVELFVALLSPLIALTVAYIAYQQWKTNRSREDREELQIKLAIYRRVKKFLRGVDETRATSAQAVEEFKEAVAEADFVFPKELTDWLSDIEGDATAWLDGHQRISLYIAQNQQNRIPNGYKRNTCTWRNQ